MSKVVVMDHPLIQHKIGWIRRVETSSKDFRTLVSEIAMLMCYEATRDLKLADGILNLIPAAKVGHIGLYHDPNTKNPVEYYCKLPD